jgi:hypothetical protein
MVGILIDHDLVAGPVPVYDDVVVVGCDIPEEVVEPEAFPVSALQPEYMLRSKAAAEASARPRLSELVMRIKSDSPMIVFMSTSLATSYLASELHAHGVPSG